MRCTDMSEHILAVDPGGTTGLAWCPVSCLGMKLDDRFGSMVEMGQVEGSVSEQAAKLGKGIVRLKVRAVISETSDHFLLAPRASKGAFRKHSLIPIKMSGAMQALVGIQNSRFREYTKSHPVAVREQYEHANIWPITFVEQTPSQAKSVVSDDVLEALGLGWQNKNKERHQLDAARHLVLFLRRYVATWQTSGGDGRSPFRMLIDSELDWDEQMRSSRLAAMMKGGDDG